MITPNVTTRLWLPAAVATLLLTFAWVREAGKMLAQAHNNNTPDIAGMLGAAAITAVAAADDDDATILIYASTVYVRRREF